MRNYNDEIKVLNDLKYRYALITCEGGYGNNPEVMMMSHKSTIFNGFIKDVEVNFIGKDENDNNIFERFLCVDSEYGHEIKLPYEKILGMEIMTNKEQARLEEYLRSKDKWEREIDNLNKMLNGEYGEVNEDLERTIKSSIKGYEYALEQGEKLVEKGVKTFK